MHIPEGVLAAPVLVAGAGLAAAGLAAGLRSMDHENTVKVAVTSSAFFVASLIHVPVGMFSAHLVLNGLTGLLLGWAAVPAIAVGLLLQALLFGFGGFTTLGVNVVIMAAPAVCCYYLFHWAARSRNPNWVFFAGFGAGLTGIALGSLLLVAVLLTTGVAFLPVAGAVFLAHVPIMVLESFVTGSTLAFLYKVRPETLSRPTITAAADHGIG